MRWAGHVAHMEEKRNAYLILVGKTEGKRPLGRLRCRWEDLRKTEWDDMDCFVWLRIWTSGGLL
jgi:hypothetical protein